MHRPFCEFVGQPESGCVWGGGAELLPRHQPASEKISMIDFKNITNFQRFDGERVTSPDFPSETLDYTSRCGVRITQSMLVEVCKQKTQNQKPIE